MRVHVGDVCTEMPAPHSSDGGIPVQKVGVSVWEGQVQEGAIRQCKLSRVAGASPNHIDREKVRLLHRREGCAGCSKGSSCCKGTSREGRKVKSQSTATVKLKRLIRLPSTKDRQKGSE